jgi:hypothetical protein
MRVPLWRAKPMRRWCAARSCRTSRTRCRYPRHVARDREAGAPRSWRSTRHLAQPAPHAEGEWLCLDARATYDAHGAGTAFARLYDARGAIGLSSQSLLVRGLESRPESWRRFSK